MNVAMENPHFYSQIIISQYNSSIIFHSYVKTPCKSPAEALRWANSPPWVSERSPWASWLATRVTRVMRSEWVDWSPE